MKPIGCQPEDHPRIGRRELIQAGAVSLLGAGLADLLRLEAQAVPRLHSKRAKAVVFIFQSGGPSQHETFDPKPDAPDTIRGEYGTTQTKLPGVRFCEYLPRLAARADRFAVVRTMHHIAGGEDRNDHIPGGHRLLAVTVLTTDSHRKGCSALAGILERRKPIVDWETRVRVSLSIIFAIDISAVSRVGS